jgi:hypothetical protein
MKKKRLLIIVIIVAAILLVPLIAMLFTNEVKWTIFDFIVAGFLLLGTALTVDLVLRKVNKFWLRVAILAIVLLVLLLIWVELAVGIFDSPIAGN